MSRRTFTTLLAGAAAAPATSWAQAGKIVYYASIGPEFGWYDLDVAAAARGSAR